MVKFIVKLIMKSFFHLKYRISVEGLGNLPKDNGYILCSNHINLQDPLVVGISIPFNIRYMAKKELFNNPLLGGFLKFAGGFPVDRDGNDLSAIKTSLKVLKNNEALLIFAEGTRNKTPMPLEAKPGVAMIAFKSKVPIVPTTIDSSYRIFSKVHIKFHSPIYLDEYYGEKLTTDDYQKITQGIIDKVYEDAHMYKKSVIKL